MRFDRIRAVAFAGLALTFALGAAGAQSADKSVCKDGSKSAVSGRGACSGHGGVDSAATAAAKRGARADKAAARQEKMEQKDAKKVEKTEKAADKGAKVDAKADAKADKAVAKADDKSDKDAAGATAQCKDGTYSHAKTTKGACSRHGGIAKVLKS